MQSVQLGNGAPYGNRPLEQPSRQHERRENRQNKTDKQRKSESGNGTGTEYEQHDSREDRRYVTVYNRIRGFSETCMVCRHHRLAVGILFLYALVYDNVTVYHHAERKYNTRDARQRELHERNRRQQEEHQSHICEHTYAGNHSHHAVEQAHEYHYKHERYGAADQSRGERVFAKRGIDDRTFYKAECNGERAAHDLIGKSLRFFVGKVAGYGGLSARYRLVYLRRGNSLIFTYAVPDAINLYILVRMRRRYIRKYLRAFGIERKRNNILSVEYTGLRVGNDVASEDRFSVGCAVARQHEFEIDGFADYREYLVRIIDVRNFDANTVGTLSDYRSFGVSSGREQICKLRYGTVHTRVSGVCFVSFVNGVNAALEIETELDGRNDTVLVHFAARSDIELHETRDERNNRHCRQYYKLD